MESIHNNFSLFHVKIQIQVVINHLIEYFSTYTYVYTYILHLFGSFNGRIPLPMQHSQFHLLEQLPLSLCTYPFFTFWAFVCFWKIGFGSGLPIFINSGVSLNLKVIT